MIHASGPVISTETLHPGQGWARVLRRHQALRLTDLRGPREGSTAGCIALLAYSDRDRLERYNMPDTLKAQHTAFLTAGRVLMSDMGHVLLSVTADSCGWHDTITGHQLAGESLERHGSGTYQDLRNGFHRNTRENLLIELAKHGLGMRDLHANANLFAKVSANADGALAWVPGHAAAGATIDLRAEMDVLVVLSNTPHAMDPGPRWDPPPFALSIYRAGPPGPDDPCRCSRPENRRAFTLTEALVA